MYTYQVRMHILFVYVYFYIISCTILCEVFYQIRLVVLEWQPAPLMQWIMNDSDHF